MTTAKTPRYVGIMVCETNGDPPFSSKPFYRRLSLIGSELGLTVFVFCPRRFDPERRRIVGYTYLREQKRWSKKTFPLPHVVYDRCFFSSGSKYALYRDAIRKLAGMANVRFLGYGLKGKWQVYQLLKKEPALLPHLPETEQLNSIKDLSRWLTQKKEVILKPQGGSHGKGVLLVQERENGIYTVTGRDARNGIVGKSFRNLRSLLRWIDAFIGQRNYVMQQFLVLRTKDGKPFDIRALVQKNRIGEWELTGMAVRLGQPGGVTSNLHGGGRAEEVLPFLTRQFGKTHATETIEKLRGLAMQIPGVLERYHGRLVELGIDLGVDDEGRIWILEVNSKPGRSAFAALPDRRVRLSAIRNPILYARYLLENAASRSGR